MFDGSWSPVNTPGAFVDPRLPSHYAPFGIQTIGDRVFVTYGKQQPGSDDEAHGRGLGIVDAYDLDGSSSAGSPSTGSSMLRGASPGRRRRSAASAATCWSATSATGRSTPTEEMSNGHFEHRGTLHAATHGELSIDGLWALEFGNTGSNGDPDTLFFTAGTNDEADGLFGTITPQS